MKVLVAISDQLFGAALIRFVREHNWSGETEVKLISVVPPVERQPGRTKQEKEILFNGEKIHFGRVLSRLQRHLLKARPDLIVSYEVFEGSVPTEILSCAKEWGASMIAMGSHGRTGVERLLLGSVSFYVASHAPCSFTILRIPDSEVLDIDLDEDDIPEEMKSYV